MTGCTTCPKRTNDFKDIFDFSIPRGFGAHVHASLLGLGLGYNQTMFGLEDGFFYTTDLRTNCMPFIVSPQLNAPNELGLILINFHANALDNLGPAFYSNYKLFGIIPSGPDGKAKLSKSYYTKITASATFGYGVKIGFNPGEFLDFLLGWVGVDIYNDDSTTKNKSRNNFQEFDTWRDYQSK